MTRRPAFSCGNWIGFVDQACASDLLAFVSIFKCRRALIIARLTTLDRLVSVDGGFTFDIDLFAFNQARRFVGLL